MLFILGLLILVSFYLVRMRQLVRKRGLDPSLATYASPLMSADLNGQRFLIVLLGIARLGLSGNLAEFIFFLVLTFELVHIVILLVYERAPTQPFYYFCLAGLASGMIVWLPGPTSLLAIIIYGLAELELRRWRHNSTKSYDAWIARKASALAAKYKSELNAYPANTRFWIMLVATTEDIARPKFVRFIERAYFLIKRPPVISSGIMQVATRRPITDRQSFKLGAKIVSQAVKRLPTEGQASQLNWLAKHYNGSTSYALYLGLTFSGVKQAWQKLQR